MGMIVRTSTTENASTMVVTGRERLEIEAHGFGLVMMKFLQVEWSQPFAARFRRRGTVKASFRPGTALATLHQVLDRVEKFEQRQKWNRLRCGYGGCRDRFTFQHCRLARTGLAKQFHGPVR